MDAFLELQTNTPGELRQTVTCPAALGEDDITGQLGLRFAGIEAQRDSTALVIFALTFPMGIATNVIADRISDHLKRRNARDQFQRAFITFEEETDEFDSQGNRITMKTTRRIEITID